MLGDSRRTVQYWLRRFEEEGLSGLAEGDRPGRPRRLTEAQMRSVEGALRKRPEVVGLTGTLPSSGVGRFRLPGLGRPALPLTDANQPR